MARARIDRYWQERIKGIAENEPNRTNASIYKELKDEAQALGRDDYPSLRTVGNYRREFLESPDDDRRPYRFLSWPESLERGDLPWEASGAAVELLQLWLQAHGTGRPTIQLALWYWRVRLARPDLPKGACVRIATLAADTRRGLHPEDTIRSLEADMLMPDGRAGFSPGGKYTYPRFAELRKPTDDESVQGWESIANAFVKANKEKEE